MLVLMLLLLPRIKSLLPRGEDGFSGGLLEFLSWRFCGFFFLSLSFFLLLWSFFPLLLASGQRMELETDRQMQRKKRSSGRGAELALRGMG